MITVKNKAGMLAGAILTATVVSMPAQAATTYNTNFSVFDTSSGVIQTTPLINVTGTTTYTGSVGSTLQDLSTAQANDSSLLQYNWTVSIPAIPSLGTFNLNEGNSAWTSFTNPPLNVGGFPNPFQISDTLFVLKPLVAGQFVQLFDDAILPSGIQFEGDTSGYSYILGKAAPIPTPALLPGLLGFGATIVRRKKKQAEAAA